LEGVRGVPPSRKLSIIWSFGVVNENCSKVKPTNDFKIWLIFISSLYNMGNFIIKCSDFIYLFPNYQVVSKPCKMYICNKNG